MMRCAARIKRIRMRKYDLMKTVKRRAPRSGEAVIIAFVAVFASVALIFGAVFGIIAAVRKAVSAAEYSGVSVDEPTASYLASYYKYRYIADLRAQNIEAYDDTEFWHQTDDGGVSYGSRLVLGTRNYISDILVANYYFDRYAKLDSGDREAIDEGYEAVLSRFESSELEEKLELLHTDKTSVRRAIEMQYKANRAKTEIYGVGGATLMGYPDECERYLAEYSRVKLLFIRSRDTFVLDSDGNRIYENGEYEMRDLTAEELAEREALIARIDEEIRGYENGGNIQITESLFEGYIDAFGEGESDKTSSGYYFSPTSVYTIAFATDVSEDVVKTALLMDIGEYRKLDVGFATCYVYKCAVESGAYTDTSEKGFFADFYSDAADFLFVKMLEDLRDEAVFSGKLDEDDIIDISYNSDLYVRF